MSEMKDAHNKLEARVSSYFSQPDFGVMLRVRKESDTVLWHNSVAYNELLSYINRTATAIQGLSTAERDSGYAVSETMERLCSIFDRLQVLMTAMHTPTYSTRPYQHTDSLRPGAGESYRNWSRHMLRSIFNLVEQALPANKCGHVNELAQYLAGSFGNCTRIDYGTGHELSFVFFLCALFRANVLQSSDVPAAALLLFGRYLCFVRRLQQQFGLKPAGSQYCYSIDDYQFVAFLWGAAQLSYRAPFAPKQLLQPALYTQESSNYLLAGCVAYVASSKEGNFNEHSNLLWGMVTLSSWPKIYHGLYDMYRNEVLSQFHLLRHLCFGNLMPFCLAPPKDKPQRAQLGFVAAARESQQQQPETVTATATATATATETAHSGLSTGSSSSSLHNNYCRLRSLSLREPRATTTTHTELI